jgi:hypothetical protein
MDFLFPQGGYPGAVLPKGSGKKKATRISADGPESYFFSKNSSQNIPDFVRSFFQQYGGIYLQA